MGQKNLSAVKDRIDSILVLYPPSGVKRERDDATEVESGADDQSNKLNLIMFYWDEKAR